MRWAQGLGKHSESIRTWTDSLSHIAQVVALLVGGIWTYRVFVLSEAPSLEARGDISVNLDWQALTSPSDSCLGRFRVVFNNQGKRALDLRQVRVEGWLTDGLPSKPAPREISTETLVARGQKFFDRGYPGSVLIGHYPPGIGRHDMFFWQFQNKAPDKTALFRVTLSTCPKQEQAAAYAWDFICNPKNGGAEPPHQQASPAPPTHS
jgi:hypothetical protein